MPISADEIELLHACATQLEVAGLQLVAGTPDLGVAGEALQQAAIALRSLRVGD